MAYSSTHWSTLETCKQFVHQILLPYCEKQIADLALPTSQKILWLIDCWSIHKSVAFLSWVKDNHPCICLVFIPANCISKFQPAIVILQRPLKHAFSREFNLWTSSIIKDQVLRGLKPEIDFKMSTLKPYLCLWLHTAWLSLASRKEMIQKGWSKCDLLEAFELEFQILSIEVNAASPLFLQNSTKVEEIIEREGEGNDEVDSEETTETILQQCLHDATIASSSTHHTQRNCNGRTLRVLMREKVDSVHCDHKDSILFCQFLCNFATNISLLFLLSGMTCWLPVA